MRCPCSSGKDYEDCCKPFHEGNQPENALQLMRSRYSAYALKLIDYIIETTHPECVYYHKDKEKWKKEVEEFCDSANFKKLAILDDFEEDKIAFVTFVVHLDHLNEDATFTERSYFVKENDKWLYRDGIIKKGVRTQKEMVGY
jgi:uncharacterized protein YchJ